MAGITTPPKREWELEFICASRLPKTDQIHRPHPLPIQSSGAPCHHPPTRDYETPSHPRFFGLIFNRTVISPICRRSCHSNLLTLFARSLANSPPVAGFSLANKRGGIPIQKATPTLISDGKNESRNRKANESLSISFSPWGLFALCSPWGWLLHV